MFDEEKRYIKLTDSDAVTAPDPNVPGIEEEFVYKMAHNFRVDITEKQDDLIMSAIQHIGGDIYHRITIDKSKVLDALGKYVPKRVVVEHSCGTKLFHCPTCNTVVMSHMHRCAGPEKYCAECGQKLDWTEDSEDTDEEVE